MLALADTLRDQLSVYLENIHFDHDELVLTARRAQFMPLMRHLKNDANLQFQQLIDITAVDYPERADRFEVVYNLLSVTQNRRIRVKMDTDADTPVPSLCALYASAGWFERETWDMYGIFFEGNPDHRRILTDYGFDGHPLRKDFPLTGFVELRYDPEQQRVVYDPVQLPQDYRVFDFESPWDGMTNVQLPGDEKAVKQRFAAGEKA